MVQALTDIDPAELQTLLERRADFPVLGTQVHGKPLIYLDNGATTQKPRRVIDAMSHFLEAENANIHRGVHFLSMEATRAYDEARAKVAGVLNAADPAEVTFVRGTTEAINLVAQSFLRPRLQEGDEIVVTEMEHHANIVPWQMVAEEVGAKLVPVSVTAEGEVDVAHFRECLNDRTRMVAFMHVSNVLGTVNPVGELTAIAKERDLPVLIDGAQAIAHGPVDVTEIGCDFYCFSGHKVFGPDGIGVLWGKKALLEAMPPYQGGGDMIEKVSFEGSTFKRPPERFEAGTPNISGAIGLGVALDYLGELGWEAIHHQETSLLERAESGLRKIPGLKIQGEAEGKASVISFTLQGVHPHDIGTVLDTQGIAIRVGNHCAMPLMKVMGTASTARASFSFYNTLEEADALAAGVGRVAEMFA